MTDQTDAQHPDEPEGGADQAPAPTPAQSEKKAQRQSQRPDVSYTSVSNGMDYLVSVFQHLTEGEKPPGARDLKYTVLHLQAATEVLLKARLAQEHFSLIFQNPAEATHGPGRAASSRAAAPWTPSTACATSPAWTSMRMTGSASRSSGRAATPSSTTA